MGFANRNGQQFIAPIKEIKEINVEVNVDNFPDELKTIDQWVVWSHVIKKDGTESKSPVYIKNGALGMAKWGDAENLMSYATACSVYESSDLIQGVGFVFTDDDPFVFIDFDKLQPNDDRLDWIKYRKTFIEWSQSGSGLHVIVKGNVRKAHKPTTGEVEIYGSNRFCALTGKLAGDKSLSISEDQPLIDALIEAYPYEKNQTPAKSNRFKLPEKIETGTRNDTLWKYCCSLFATGKDEETVLDLLYEANEERCDEPLTDEVIEDMVPRALEFVATSNEDNNYGEDLIDNYCYIATEGIFVHKKHHSTYSKKDFNDMLAKYYSTDRGAGIAATLFLTNQNRLYADDLTWIPTGRSGPDNLIVTDSKGKRSMNLWQGIEATPEKGDVDLWYKLLHHLVPDENERNALLDWLAAQVQFPEIKTNWQVIHIGTHGCGKDSLYKPIGMIFGHSADTVSIEELYSQFNSYLYKKRFLIFEEIYKPGMRDFDVANKLKLIAADTASGMFSINKKFMQPIQQANKLGFVALSNNPDCLFVEENERRYFTINSEVQPLPPEFYAEYHDALLNENLHEAVYFELLERDLSNFSFAVMPFTTEATKVLKETSKTDYQGDLIEMIEAEFYPFNNEIVMLADVKEALRDAGYNHVSGRLVHQTLHQNGFEKVRGTKRIKGKLQTTPRFYVKKSEVKSDMTPTDYYDMYNKGRKKTI